MSDQAWLAFDRPGVRTDRTFVRSWTLIRAGGAIEPKPIHFDDLPSLLADHRGQ